IMPYSEGFKAASTAGNPTDLLYVLLSNLWLCATIVFLVKNSVWSGRKLLLGIVFTLFMIYCFMTQIETWFFGSDFPLLTCPDIISIALANATPIFVATPLALRLFASQRKEITTKGVSIRWNKSFIARLLLLGVGYMVLYFIFGYFV